MYLQITDDLDVQ